MKNRLDILLIEDSPSDIELTRRVLQKHRAIGAVHVVTDGEEALDFLFAEGRHAARAGAPPPDIVLLDLHLPKIGGLSVLQSIRTDHRTRSLVIVALTSSDEDQDILRSYAFGVDSYVVKPLDAGKLTALLSEVGFSRLLLDTPRTETDADTQAGGDQGADPTAKG